MTCLLSDLSTEVTIVIKLEDAEYGADWWAEWFAEHAFLRCSQQNRVTVEVKASEF